MNFTVSECPYCHEKGDLHSTDLCPHCHHRVWEVQLGQVLVLILALGLLAWFIWSWSTNPPVITPGDPLYRRVR